jgi:hypothetical protein
VKLAKQLRLTFDVVIAGNRHDLDLLVRRSRELHRLIPQPFSARAVELSQDAHDSCFLAGTGWTEEHQMWEILLFAESFEIARLVGVVVELGQLTGTVLINPQSHFDEGIYK